MTPKLRKGLIWILAIIFVVSTAQLIRHSLALSESADSYQTAEAIAAKPREEVTPVETIPEETLPVPEEPTEPPVVWAPAPMEADEYMKQLQDINLEALRDVNPDVVGWIFVPNCKINYPIVQGEDNQYYLNHTWNNRKSVAGAIFMESTNKADFSDFRTIIYGHNMADFSMFGSLYRYDTEYSWSRCPYVYLVTDEGVLRYEVYSCYRANVESGTYALDLEEEPYRASFIHLTKEEARYETNITPATTDRLITLSTCAGGETMRRVVHARLPMVPVEMKTDSPQ